MLTISSLKPGLSAILISMAGLATFLATSEDWISERSAFVTTTVILLLYLAIEVNRVCWRHPERWLLNPAVLCSFLTFALGFGFTNILFVLPEATLLDVGYVPEVTPSMNKLMVLVLIGAVAMWIGYWSNLAAKMCLILSRSEVLSRLFRNEFVVSGGVFWALLFVSIASRLIQIRLGVFGYSSNYDRLIEMASYTQYLNMTSSLGKLALLLAALQYFSSPPHFVARFWLIGLLVFEILVGFLSGFKSQVVMPLIIVGLCRYLISGRLPWRWVALVPVAILVAYAVIEPYRIARNADATFIENSPISIAKTMVAATTSWHNESVEADEAGTPLRVAARTNMTYIGSLGVSFADQWPMPEDSPDFLGDIVLAPVHAWIPRLIWEDKSLQTIGVWYTRTVLGHNNYTSTAMGPFTYLYFAGGASAVFLGFGFIGVIQRVASGALVRLRSGEIILFFGLLSTLILIDSGFNAIPVVLFRYVPIFLLIQRVVLAR